MTNWKKIIGLIFTALLLTLMIGLVLYNAFFGDNEGGIKKPEINQTFQCSDAIDNDNDGLTDYPDDPDCSSLDDKYEKDFTLFKYTIFGALIMLISGSIGYGIYKFYNSNDEDEEENKFNKPVPPNEAWLLARQWFLTEKATGIECVPDKEAFDKYNIEVMKPKDPMDCYEYERRFDERNGQRFQFSFIEVNDPEGNWPKYNVLTYCINAGKQWLKDGNISLEYKKIPKNNNVWSPQRRDFNLASNTNQFDLLYQQLENANENNNTELAKHIASMMQNMNKSGTQPSDEETEEEYSQRISQAIKQGKMNTTKRKTTAQKLPQPSYSGGDDE